MPADRRSTAECRALLEAANGAALKRLITELADDPRAGVQAAVESARRRIRLASAERRRLDKLLAFERELHAAGAAVIAGVDEVGRGALAGPVSAAAVVLGTARLPEGLDDSKRVPPERRETLGEIIRCTCTAWSVAHVEAERIDAIGIAKATREAMSLALEGLGIGIDHVIVDGISVRIHPNESAVPKADAKIACVAAASIVAKVARDALMCELAGEHSLWALEENKGYGTAEHTAAILAHGLSAIHRRSFTLGGGTGRLL